MKELICIVCPVGCHLQVDESNDYKVTGNQCKRGLEYGKKELTNPTRTITTTATIKNGIHNRIPIKTDQEVPKHLIFDIMKEINQITLEAPIKMGTVVYKNILNTGSNIITTRSMKKREI